MAWNFRTQLSHFFGLLLAATILISCNLMQLRNMASELGGNAGVSGEPSNYIDQNIEVELYKPQTATQTIPGPRANFRFGTPDQIQQSSNDLKLYIYALYRTIFVNGNNLQPHPDREGLLDVNGSNVQLEFENIRTDGDRVFIRFSQIIYTVRSKFSGQNQDIVISRLPVVGASIVATVIANKLVSLNSSLIATPSIRFIAQNPGFNLSRLSDKEILLFVQRLKTADFSLVNAYLSQAGDGPFDTARFLKRPFREQKQILIDLFEGLDRDKTVFFIFQLIEKGRLKIRIKDQTKWYFEVTRLFDLDLRNNLVIDGDRLYVTNMRKAHQRVSVNVHWAQDFPVGTMTQAFSFSNVGGDISADTDVTQIPQYKKLETLAINVEKIANYFESNFGWKGVSGHDANQKINVYGLAAQADYAQNAAWLTDFDVMVVGKGGPILTNFENSLGILGHEYCHGIINNSSQLIYEGESGALNEHFADLFGAAVQDFYNNDFDYTIGGNVLSRKLATVRGKLMMEKVGPVLGLHRKHRMVNLRNMIVPEASLAHQFSHADEARDYYGVDCIPAIENDYCGVHSVSGVPNRASARAILKIHKGISSNDLPVVTLFFKTLTNRLTADSGFNDYLRQLNLECEEGNYPTLNCRDIELGFNEAGIFSPDNPRQPGDGNSRVTSKSSYIPPGHRLSSPELEFWGVVQKVADGYRLYDNNFNVGVVTAEIDEKTVIPNTLRGAFKEGSCSCVRGRVSHRLTEDNEVENIFLNLSSVNGCSQAIKRSCSLLQRAVPESETISTVSKNGNQCGWVKIVDHNTIDIVGTGIKSRITGKNDELESLNCACVKGQFENHPSIIYRKIFTRVDEVAEAKDELCYGIEWY